MRLVIVGSGFAGSILARILQRLGHAVRLVERGAHPRFAIGESSTPLAAICLERLAARYDLPDLRYLAAYGRWMEHIPEVRRGLKRGFTFYSQLEGEPYRNDDRNCHRLLVAASPSDSVADSHWLREDVDHFLVQRAAAEGVEYLDRTELTELDSRNGGFRLAGSRDGRRVLLEADLVVDATGATGFLAQHLPIASKLYNVGLRTGLVFGHFESVGSFRQVAEARGACLPPGPYRDEQAAVHHLLPEGWMYQLPFDHGVVSAGFVVEHGDLWEKLSRLPPEAAFRHLLERYPALKEQFATARPTRPVAVIPRLQRRSASAAGPGWALLPHAFAFWSPMFSTGIAWSLLGVERLALLLEPLGSSPSASRLEAELARYATLLESEADHLQQLLEGAYRARHDFDVFAAYTYLYFAAASYAEAAQRLLPPPAATGSWAWDGFLGSTDPTLRTAVRQAAALVKARTPPEGAPEFARRYLEEIGQLIRPRNLAGLADPERNRLYPVDLDALVASAHLLGLRPADIRQVLPRLRGGG